MTDNSTVLPEGVQDAVCKFLTTGMLDVPPAVAVNSWDRLVLKEKEEWLESLISSEKDYENAWETLEKILPSVRNIILQQ